MRSNKAITTLAIAAAVISLVLLSLSATAANGFAENKGQVHDQLRKPNPAVRYLLNGPGMNVQLRRDGFAYDTYVVEEVNGGWEMANGAVAYRFHRIDVLFVQGNAHAEVVAEGASEDYSNHYTDVTGEDGALFVRSFSTITYVDVWPHIDVRFHSTADGFKYDVVVHPGGDARDARFSVQGATIGEGMNGELLFSWAGGSLEERIPESWVEAHGKRQAVAVQYHVLGDAEFGFDAGTYQHGTLVIDPTPDLYWSTYYGGTSTDHLSAVAMDGAGAAYASGGTQSTASIATAGAHDAVFTGSQNALLVKMNGNGTRAWATYYGGSGYTSAGACAYGAGVVWIGGRTESVSAIATAGAWQPSRDALSADAFLAKFNLSGVRLYATYLGGRDVDAVHDMAVDASGWVAVAGSTASDNVIATVGAADVSYGGNTDGFLARFTPAGVRAWGTYIGGAASDRANGVALSAGGAIAVCGTTASASGIASAGAWDTALSGTDDAFLASYSSGGTRQWSTYFGGTGSENGADCAWNGSGALALCGYTNSTAGIATAGAQQTVFGGGMDAMLASFTTSAGTRNWGTYAGGTCWDEFTGISYGIGQWVLGGETCSAGMATAGAYDTTHDWHDLLISGYNGTGARLHATYLGYAEPEYSSGIVAGGNLVYVVGETHTPGTFATAGAHQVAYGGGLSDGILARLNLTPAVAMPLGGGSNETTGLEVRVANERVVLLKNNADDAAGVLLVHDASGRMVHTQQWPGNTPSVELPVGISTGPMLVVLVEEDGTRRVARCAVP